jgi:hypothetical protein
MSRTQSGHKKTLIERFPPSAPCACAVCVTYCRRPGWWTVAEAGRALAAGLGPRIMLEMAPDRSFGVLSPAFYGCEGGFALNEYASHGCNFLKNNRCELFGSGLQTLECRFCHHDRPGQGPICHAALEIDWRTQDGQDLVERWARRHGLWDAYKCIIVPAVILES